MKTGTIITLTTGLLLATAGFIRSQDKEAREHLLHEFGGSYFVSREKVQNELKLSDSQRQKLQEKLSADVLQAGDLSKKIKGLRGGEKDKLMQPSYEALEAYLQANLTADQFSRFRQLQLQYEIPGIMLQPRIVSELHITDEQRQNFMTAIQEMQKTISPLIQQARSGGNAQGILIQVTNLRLDCQKQIVALLNETQKRKWEEMTGQSFIIW
ncbi:hypothetical protein [Prosthecobacter sp.]|uniref:hypothetical protein n=1 Tax=Prosthecobacter sp. TaxID=1965333 RepID=UPI00378465C5